MTKYYKFLLTTTLFIASFASIAMTGSTGSRLATSVNDFFGRTHATIGYSTATEFTDGSVLITPSSDEVAGVGIALGDVRTGYNASLNVNMEPVFVRQGASFSNELLGRDGSVLVAVRYDQISDTETNVYLVNHLAAELDEVRIATFAEGTRTTESSLSISEETFVGTVQAAGQAWMKSYHWSCDRFGCELMTDPDNTTIRLASNPDKAIPFTFLSFGFGNNDSIRNAAALHLVGSSPFTILSENTNLLNLVY